MAMAILIHMRSEGSAKPTPIRTRPAPTTPALVAACMRMKKSGRRSTPIDATRQIAAPVTRKRVERKARHGLGGR